METASGTYDSENRSVEEMTRYLNGLKRYTEKGIPIYMDGKLSGQREWEKLFEVREDGMFYGRLCPGGRRRSEGDTV